MNFCKTNGGLKLLSFQKDNPSESLEISGMLQYYQEQLGKFFKSIFYYANIFFMTKVVSTFFKESPDWARFSWTSGKFKKKYGTSENLKFESTGETWSHKETQGKWTWMDTLVVSEKEEVCMLLVEGSSSAPPKIRPTVCDIRNYFICYKDKLRESCSEPTLANSKFTKVDTKFIQAGTGSKYLYPEKMILVEPEKALGICAELGLPPASIQTLADFQHIGELIKKNDFVTKFGVHEEKAFSVLISGSARDKSGSYLTSEGKLLPFTLFSLNNFYYYVGIKFLCKLGK